MTLTPSQRVLHVGCTIYFGFSGHVVEGFRSRSLFIQLGFFIGQYITLKSPQKIPVFLNKLIYRTKMRMISLTHIIPGESDIHERI